MTEALFQVGIKALIQNEAGNLLLRCNASGRWDIPGGRMEPNESIQSALARELKDEIGLSEHTVLDHFDTILSNITIPDGEKDYGLILVLYKVSIPPNVQFILNDGDTYEWVAPNLVSERIANKYPEDFRAKLSSL